MTLNSTRNLAAFYVTGDATQKDEMQIAPNPFINKALVHEKGQSGRILRILSKNGQIPYRYEKSHPEGWLDDELLEYYAVPCSASAIFFWSSAN